MKPTMRLLPGLLAAFLVTTGGPALATALPETGIEFAPYELVPQLGSQPRYAGPTTPTSLEGVLISDQVAALSVLPRSRHWHARAS